MLPNCVSFRADGTGDDLLDLNDASNGVSLYLDVNDDGHLDGSDIQIDAESTFSADNGTVTFTTSTDTIDISTSENWLIVYDLDGSAVNSETFRIGIYNASQITATGVTSTDVITPTGFPVVGNYKTIDAVGSLSLFVGSSNPATAEVSYPDDNPMLQIKLSISSIEAINIDNITITHLGTGDPVNDIVSNGVQLIRDVNNNGVYDGGTDNTLDNTNFSGTTATFTLAPVTIPADSIENWIVIYNFELSANIGETFRARVENLTDLGLAGVSSMQSISASGSVPISGGTMTIAGDFPLPVELISFKATGGYGYIKLAWKTASEINNLGFKIEHKLTNAKDYEFVASYQNSPELIGQGSVSYETEYSYRDSTVIPEKEYMYRLIQYDYGGAVNIKDIIAFATAKKPLPKSFELLQNYPNPFNPQTKIKFEIPMQSDVTLRIYNVLGQKIISLKDGVLDAGRYSVEWNGQNDFGNNVASGIYFYVLQARTSETKKQHRMLKKMILVR